MEYSNTMKIEMSNNNEAMKAMEIIKTVITTNKESYNKCYSNDASAMLLEAIEINDNCLVISEEEFGCFTPEDAEAFTDIIEAIAVQLKSSFAAEIISVSTYSEKWLEATCDGKELNVKKTYFPSGFSTTAYCEECDEEIALFEEIEVAPNKYEIRIFEEVASGTYTCPNCGEEIDLSEELPIIETVVKNI